VWLSADAHNPKQTSAAICWLEDLFFRVEFLVFSEPKECKNSVRSFSERKETCFEVISKNHGKVFRKELPTG